MNTTLVIKASKELRDEAKRITKELGIPLTTVVNGLLKQFVREKKFSVSVDPCPTKEKIRQWENMSAEMDREIQPSKAFSDSKVLLKHLKIG